MVLDIDKLERFTEDDAFAVVVDYLQKFVAGAGNITRGSQFFDVGMKGIIAQWFASERISDDSDKISASRYISNKFYSAMWTLCLRGVLRPSVNTFNIQSMGGARIPGDDYSITVQGREWLKDQSRQPILLSSHSFLELLEPFGARFGAGFLERATEAVKCSDAGCYLACCVMCGAAAEAILLQLAIAKTKDEAATMKSYQAANGRKYIKDLLERNKPGGLVHELQSGFNLLSYWRDNAAHGAGVKVDQVNARTALNLLLGLAETADTKWTELTS